MEKIAYQNDKILFLTGDLGFMALENIRDKIKERFINVGVSEQNMIAMAAAIASEGFTPVCYSIAPFIVFRPAEQIRVRRGLRQPARARVERPDPPAGPSEAALAGTDTMRREGVRRCIMPRPERTAHGRLARLRLAASVREFGIALGAGCGGA